MQISTIRLSHDRSRRIVYVISGRFYQADSNMVESGCFLSIGKNLNQRATTRSNRQRAENKQNLQSRISEKITQGISDYFLCEGTAPPTALFASKYAHHSSQYKIHFVSRDCRRSNLRLLFAHWALRSNRSPDGSHYGPRNAPDISLIQTFPGRHEKSRATT